MRRISIVALLVGCLMALPVFAGEPTEYGDGVTLDTAVAVDDLLASPDDYLGKKVRVEGVITGVCKKRGCWMQVTDAETGNGVRIKVEDGVIVFPYTAMGKKATAEGVFDAIVLTPEQIEARAERHAAEHAEGESCDRGPEKESGCDAEVREDRIYLIRGTGAVIYS